MGENFWDTGVKKIFIIALAPETPENFFIFLPYIVIFFTSIVPQFIEANWQKCSERVRKMLPF